MPARINKTAVTETVRAIRQEADRYHTIIKTTPTQPDQVKMKQELLEGLNASLNKKCDELDRLLTIQTKF